MKNILLLLFTFSFVSFAQERELYTSEKVYLHTDRAQFVAGDTVWAKGYLMDATTHFSSPNSELVYVSLLDAAGKVLLQNKYQANQGQAAINFVLPKTLTENQYRLVAHTQLMRNFDTDFFFSKTIQIATVQPADVQIQKSTLQVQFFPEGGNLIAGLPSKIGFKANLSSGEGVELQGHIENQNGEIFSAFKTDYLGMGAFNLEAKANEKYKAVVAYGNQTFLFDLPKSTPKGLILSVENSPSKGGIFAQIRSNILDGQRLHLWAHQRGKVIFKTDFRDEKTLHKFFLKNEEITQDGIVHFTLFSTDFTPIAERLTFINNQQNEFKIALDAKHSGSLFKEKKLDYEIKATDKNGLPMANTSISVAVVDEAQQEDLPENPNMLAYLLLNSDLKGNIEKPNTYFSMKKTESRFFLDNLMLTQGWSRFVWKELNQKKYDFLIEKTNGIAGTILVNKKPFPNRALTLSIWDASGLKVAPIMTDANGHFEIFGAWAGALKIVATDNRGRELDLVFDQSNPPTFLPQTTPTKGEFASAEALIEGSQYVQKINFEEATLLDEVKITETKLMAEKRDSRRVMYGGEPDFSLEVTPILYSSYINVTDMLEGRMVGVRAGTFQVNPFDPPAEDNNISESGYLLLVDGKRVPKSFINTISPKSIERVDLLKSIGKTAIFGVLVGNALLGTIPVINILTKKDGPEITTLDKITSFSNKGFELVKEFYTPNYAINPAVIPDHRTTIYWNPAIKTDANGKASISFYNSDIAKRLLITIEGTDGKGKVGSFKRVMN